MANTLNLGDGNWGVKDSSLLGYAKDNTKFVPETFDVTRASSGTRVNKDGLIETPTEIVSGELVSNGDFSNGLTGWNDLDGSVTVVNGGAFFAINGGFGNFRLRQDIGMQEDSYYKATYTVTENIGSVKLRVFDGASYVYVDGSVGTHAVIHKRYGTNDKYYFSPHDGTSITLDNISIVEVNQDNLARIDYLDSTKGVLLTEPQSTNLITDSSDFSDASWDKVDVLITSDSTISPSGIVDATKLIASTVDTVNHNVKRTVTVSTATDYSVSFFAKKGEYNYVSTFISALGGAYTWDLNNGTVVLGSGRIEDYGNGWFRCIVEGNTTSTSLSYRIYVNKFENRNTTFQGDGTSGIYIWGAQLEELSYATSYMPTYGEIASRAGDVINNGGDVNNFNSEEGVLFAEIARSEGNSETSAISLSNGTSVNQITFYYFSTNRIFFDIIGSSPTISVGVTVPSTSDFNKIALKYKSGDISLWVNGSEVITRTDTMAVSGLNNLSLTYGNGSYPFNGKTKNVQVFNEALTDAQLITLTTI